MPQLDTLRRAIALPEPLSSIFPVVALGAQHRELQSMVVRQGVVLASVGILLGLAAAAASGSYVPARGALER